MFETYSNGEAFEWARHAVDFNVKDARAFSLQMFQLKL
jgi:hypothetical protein